MNETWVEKNLDYLNQKLNRNIFKEFEPTPLFYFSISDATDLHDALHQLCSHIGITIIPEIEIVGDSDIPVLDLQKGTKYFEKVIDSAGDIKSTSSYTAKIRIGVHQLYRAYNIGQVLSHEVTHHFLHLKNITPIKENENEMFTDLAAIHIGFGKLTVNGASDKPNDYVSEPIHFSEQGIPYLGYPLLAYAYFYSQTQKGARKSSLLEFTNGPCVNFIKSFYFYKNPKLTKLQRFWESLSRIPKLPDTDGTKIIKEAGRLDESIFRIVKCIGCGIDLRIPKTDKILMITCPECKKVFKVGIKYKQA
jgi:hypothetical protein